MRMRYCFARGGLSPAFANFSRSASSTCSAFISLLFCFWFITCDFSVVAGTIAHSLTSTIARNNRRRSHAERFVLERVMQGAVCGRWGHYFSGLFTGIEGRARAHDVHTTTHPQTQTCWKELKPAS